MKLSDTLAGQRSEACQSCRLCCAICDAVGRGHGRIRHSLQQNSACHRGCEACIATQAAQTLSCSSTTDAGADGDDFRNRSKL